MAERIYTVCIHSCWATGRVDHIFTADQHKAFSIILRRSIQAKQSANSIILTQHTNDLHFVQYRYTIILYGTFQTFGHLFAGVRSNTGSTAAWIMVRFIADIFAIPIPRKRHTKFNKFQEALCRKRSFAQCDVTIYTAALIKRLCHFTHTVRVAAGKCQLVIGLLVASCVAAGTTDPVFCNQQNIVLSQFPKAVSCIESCRTAADNSCIATVNPCSIVTNAENFVFHRILLFTGVEYGNRRLRRYSCP